MGVFKCYGDGDCLRGVFMVMHFWTCWVKDKGARKNGVGVGVVCGLVGLWADLFFPD